MFCIGIDGVLRRYCTLYDDVVQKQTTAFLMSLKPQLNWRPNTVVILSRSPQGFLSLDSHSNS